MTRRRLLLLLAVLATVPVLRIASTWTTFSQTIDEPIHLAAGFQWLDEGAYTLDREHPPLARVFFAADAWLDEAEVDPGLDRAGRGNQLFDRNEEYRRNLAFARAGNLPFFLLALVVVFLWTRRLAGDVAGLIAAAVFGTLPPVLAHAGLATTDMAAAAGTVTALYAFVLWLDRPSWTRTLLLGAVLAVGLLGKFSFLIFFGVGFLVLGVRAFFFSKGDGTDRTDGTYGTDRTGVSAFLLSVLSVPSVQWVLRLLVACFVAILLIWLGYRGETGLVNTVRLATFRPDFPEHIAAKYSREPGYEWVRPDLLDRYYDYTGEVERKHGIAGIDFVDWARAAGYPSPLAGRKGNTLAGAPPLPQPTLGQRIAEPFRASWQWIATHVPLPAPSYVAGVEYVGRHSATGHPAWLFGESRATGWWYYFPVILFYKTPLPFLVLASLGMVLLVRRRGEAAAIALIPLAMLGAATTSSINIGVRHILPLYPFLTIAAGVAVVWMGRRAKAARITAAVLLVWLFAGTALAHPDYLAWFNEAAGRHPERITADSNLDWGQDLLRLAAVAEREKLEPLYVGYWGSADWRPHLRGAREVPNHCVAGWTAISEMTWLEKRDTSLGWLKAHTPRRRVGKSIRLYFVPSC